MLEKLFSCMPVIEVFFVSRYGQRPRCQSVAIKFITLSRSGDLGRRHLQAVFALREFHAIVVESHEPASKKKRQAFWHHLDRASGPHHDETSISVFE